MLFIKMKLYGYHKKECQKFLNVTEKCSLTADDGKNYNTTIYNLDAIIAVGYRVNSKKSNRIQNMGNKNIKRIYDKRFCFK